MTGAETVTNLEASDGGYVGTSTDTTSPGGFTGDYYNQGAQSNLATASPGTGQNIGGLSSLGTAPSGGSPPSGTGYSAPGTLPTTSYGALVGPDGQPIELAGAGSGGGSENPPDGAILIGGGYVNPDNGHHIQIWEVDPNGPGQYAGFVDYDDGRGLMGQALDASIQRQNQAANALQALATGAQAAKDLLDFFGSFNPIVAGSTVVGGQTASGQPATAGDELAAIAVLVPGEAALSVIARVLRGVAESKVLQIVEEGETLQKSGALANLSEEALRIYYLARDPAEDGVREFEALSAWRFEQQTGIMLERATGGGEDFKAVGSGITYDLIGGIGKDAWQNPSFSITAFLNSLARKLSTNPGTQVIVDLSDASTPQAESVLNALKTLQNTYGKQITILR
jgi:hypothetical protein